MESDLTFKVEMDPADTHCFPPFPTAACRSMTAGLLDADRVPTDGTSDRLFPHWESWCYVIGPRWRNSWTA